MYRLSHTKVVSFHKNLKVAKTSHFLAEKQIGRQLPTTATKRWYLIHLHWLYGSHVVDLFVAFLFSCYDLRKLCLLMSESNHDPSYSEIRSAGAEVYVLLCCNYVRWTKHLFVAFTQRVMHSDQDAKTYIVLGKGEGSFLGGEWRVASRWAYCLCSVLNTVPIRSWFRPGTFI